MLRRQFEQTKLIFPGDVRQEPEAEQPGAIPVHYVRNARARRYVLRVNRNGTVRVTIPRGGSQSFAQRFVTEKQEWIRAQLERISASRQAPRQWGPGTPVWYRGLRWPLVAQGNMGYLAEHSFPVPEGTADWRPIVEGCLRRQAEREFPELVRKAAGRHLLTVRRIAVRDQRTRWGSCSRLGTISLNWRLIQAPILVRDYLIAHELAHLREMNHSRRYWAVVQEFFPEWREAEQWLKRHGRDLLG